MITRTRRSLATAVVRASRSSAKYHFSGAAAAPRPPEHDQSEPYGHEYGAGPSRLPYQPPSSPSTRRSTRDSARALRQAAKGLNVRVYSKPYKFLTALGVEPQNLSILERSALLHHVIRVKGGFAVGLAVYFLEHAEKRPHRVFSRRTLAALGNPALDSSLKGTRRAPGPLPNGQPTIEEQRPIPTSKPLERLLLLLNKLYDIRHPRPEELYQLVILQCMFERRADLAANIYVGLVEEWIIEGRIAEGADPEDFYPGGGPSKTKQLVTTSSSKDKLLMWFTGVRTWRLPGEAISPHERQDLWHPKHHSTHEKLRGWPMVNPTSPPSLVPHPHMLLLSPIISGLAQDPKVVDAAEYAASMRAIATLASTILNRTLPVPAVPKLLKAFSTSLTFPVVYPVTFEKAPQSNAWAYTANTQVHVALVDLLFAPPNYNLAHKIESATKPNSDKLAAPDSPANLFSGPAAYMLPPLGWGACMVLVRYTLDQLRQPRLLNRLIGYMRKVWDPPAPSLYNKIFRSTTKQQDNEMAQKVEDLLFGDSPLRRTTVKVPVRAPQESETSANKTGVLCFPSLDVEGYEIPQADEGSLAALVLHLTATSQFDRLVQITYLVMPYLSVSFSTPQEQAKALTACLGEEFVGASGRIRPTELDAHTYSVILNGLAKGGFTGLAQRVFRLAKSFENRDMRRDGREKNNLPHPVRYRIPIVSYTTMIQLYGGEAQRTLTENNATPLGWKMNDAPRDINRNQQGEVLAWRTYKQGMGRWYRLLAAHNSVDREVMIRCVPDARFFNATIRALHKRWELGSDVPVHAGRLLELQKVCNDMEGVGITPPLGLVYKLKTGRANGHGSTIPIDDNNTECRPTERRVFLPVRRELERRDKSKRLARNTIDSTPISTPICITHSIT